MTKYLAAAIGFILTTIVLQILIIFATLAVVSAAIAFCVMLLLPVFGVSGVGFLTAWGISAPLVALIVIVKALLK